MSYRTGRGNNSATTDVARRLRGVTAMIVVTIAIPGMIVIADGNPNRCLDPIGNNAARRNSGETVKKIVIAAANIGKIVTTAHVGVMIIATIAVVVIMIVEGGIAAAM
jgi:hypothetical protein